MKVLLDTQITIWWNSDSSKLSAKTKELISDPQVEKFISLAGIWEMAIKIKIGKLQIQPDLHTFVTKKIKENGMSLLPIDEHAIYVTQKLELYHQDPFDRLMIAQAIVENLPVITTDSVWKRYPIHILP